MKSDTELTQMDKKIQPGFLMETEKRYHSLFQNMTEGFARCRMFYDNDEPIDFMYLEVNAAFEKLTGLKNVVGKRISEILVNHKQENPELFNLYDRVARTGVSEQIETFVAPLEIWFSISVYSSEKGQFLLIFNNITKRKQAEQTLKESEASLKELNASKDKLFSLVAHDLRSPFNAILGLSELLFNNINNLELTESKKYLGIINSSTKNTLVLLDNLLNWTRSQTGRINFNARKLVLSTIIQQTIELSNSNALMKNISVSYNQLNEIEVYADENMLCTILRNLISNAIKFTNPGGQINIFATPKSNQVEITVSDNGVGIDEVKLKTLFDLSTNTSCCGTAKERGSGLGLVLCKEFTEKNGGKIWVESEIGKGSAFKFTLPSILNEFMN